MALICWMAKAGFNSLYGFDSLGWITKAGSIQRLTAALLAIILPALIFRLSLTGVDRITILMPIR